MRKFLEKLELALIAGLLVIAAFCFAAFLLHFAMANRSDPNGIYDGSLDYWVPFFFFWGIVSFTLAIVLNMLGQIRDAKS